MDSDSTRGLHYIEDDLTETWIEDWAGKGVEALEDSLEKHLAFEDFLGEPEYPRQNEGRT